MKYVKRLAELALVAGGAAVADEVARNGLDLSAAGLKGLGVAAAATLYGLLVKGLGGDKESPTVQG